jgi:TonB family protein
MVLLGGTLSLPQNQEPREQAAQTASSEGALRNEDIIKLAKVGIDDAIIIAKIGKSRCQFDTSTGTLIQLKQSGVSAAVLEAMAGASPGTPTVASTGGAFTVPSTGQGPAKTTSAVTQPSGQFAGAPSKIESTASGSSQTSAPVAESTVSAGAKPESSGRYYIKFTIQKANQPQKVGDVAILLERTDPKKNRYTIELTADDKTVEKRDRVVNEPLQFMTSKATQPYELVVNEVRKDLIIGYLSVPNNSVGATASTLRFAAQSTSGQGANTEVEPQTADEAYRRGTRLMQTRHVDEAISMFNRAILLKPDWAQAFAARGRALSQAKRYGEAINDFDEAIRLEPEHAAWYDSRGLSYSNSGQHSRAIEDYARAIEMSPTTSAYYNNRGWAYSELGQFEEAIADLSRAIQLVPDYVKAYENRGTAYARMKDWPHAIADYTAAIQITPTAWLYQRRADAKFAAGDQSGADEDRQKAAAQTATTAPSASGAYRIGNGVTPPRLSSKVEPKYSEEARRAGFEGSVVLSVVVDTDGKPRDLRIIRPLGLGLDQKALEAVSQWRFFPGTKDGQAVPVQAQIEVNFRLLDKPR